MSATFSKLKSGDWGLRVPGKAVPGQVVAVRRKDGSTETKVVGKVLWSGPDRQTGQTVSLCTMVGGQGGGQGGRDSVGNLIRTGASYRAGVTAPGRRTCPECGSRECSKAWDPRSLCDED